ncbi:MAG: hypothetical protein WBR13_07155 [Allosphingosinicella sp.]
MSDDWQLPVPNEDPEVYKAGLVRDEKGGARLVPNDNIVEGELAEEEGGKAPSGCPFSGG